MCGVLFPEEKCGKKHVKAAISMVAEGTDRVGSCFQICLKRRAELDGKCMVFGKVLDGMDVFHDIEDEMEKDEAQRRDAVIVECGMFTGKLPDPDEFADPGAAKKAQPSAEGRQHVYLRVQIGDEEAVDVLIELWMDMMPRTAENFRCLCTGEAVTQSGAETRTEQGKGSIPASGAFGAPLGGSSSSGGLFGGGSAPATAAAGGVGLFGGGLSLSASPSCRRC